MRRGQIIGLLAVGMVAACWAGTESAVVQVGQVQTHALKEASGLVPGHRHASVYWTHNDGDDNTLFAITADGALVGKVKVDAKFKDFEDIAFDADGNLYLADTGNNDRDRKHVDVYEVAEPDPNAKDKAPVIGSWKLSFPDEPFNCESLFVSRGVGYVISKVEAGQHASIYRFSLTREQRSQALELVCDLPVDVPVTAADLSSDGRTLAVLSRGVVNLFTVNGDIARAGTVQPQRVSLPPIQTEGCCFDADGLLVIAESGEILQVKLSDQSTTATAEH